MDKFKYLKYRSKYLNLNKELFGGGIKELKIKYPNHTELIDKIYDPTDYLLEDSDYISMIQLYIDNPKLQQFIEYKPDIYRLRILLNNIDIVEYLVSYYDYYSITDKLIGLYFINKTELDKYIQYIPSENQIQLILKYADIYNLLFEYIQPTTMIFYDKDLYKDTKYLYSFKDINEDLLILLKSWPILHEFIQYGLNLDEFNFILRNISDIELFRKLHKFVKYRLKSDVLKNIIINIMYIDIYELLFENNYRYWQITVELLEILRLNPVLHEFVKYRLLYTELQYILDNIEDIELFRLLLENYIKYDLIEKYKLLKFKDIFTIIPIANTEDRHLFNPNTYYDSIDLVEENYNVGIEIEGCTEKTYYELDNFTHTTDYSVECNTGKNINLFKSEFILKGVKNKNNLLSLDKDIKKILDILSANGKFICSKTCGIHFHISNEYILFNLYGLLFLTNLIILWLDKYQEEFIAIYPYQIRIYKESYSSRNNNLFRESMVKISEHIVQSIKQNKLNDYDLVMHIFRLIRSVNNNNNFLNVYEDHKYIHIEFRGLASVAHFLDINSFIRYVKSITDLYKIAIDISIRQISS